MSKQEVNRNNIKEAVFALVGELSDEDFVLLLQGMLEACYHMPNLKALCVKEGIFEEVVNESH